MEKKAPDTTPVVLMNFTHVYERRKLYKKEPHCWIDLTDLEGVNGTAMKMRERPSGSGLPGCLLMGCILLIPEIIIM